MKNINKRDLIIRIFLIIIIILLLLHNCYLLKKINNAKNKNKNPTGNVDIFEISCNKDSCNENREEIKNETIENINNVGRLIISDKDTTWKKTNKLRMFSNPFYNMDEKIAPEDSNTYKFVIKNNANYNVKYTINFIENNPSNINMKYKLKKGNKYIVNDYVSYNELQQNNIILNRNNSDTYYLEWKWVSSDNDTEAANIESAYNISLEIKAESSYE